MSAGRLVRKDTDEDVKIGDVLTSSQGERYILRGWHAPHKISSTGRVFVAREESPDDEEQYFPTVFELEIIGAEFSRR